MTDIVKACTDDIARLVRIDSSQAEPLPGKPFGEGAAEALALFLGIAEKFGFETKNYDNYAGEVIFGEGEDLGVLCHLDVVPAGKGWTFPPFGGVIEGGKLYGRGTMDDKGPAVICLYCLKALKEEGFRPKRRIRLIVGCNEESGWACIDHLKKCAALPREGFSPDADFPAIYAEKGILQFECAFPLPDAPFSALAAGERANMVCERAEAVPCRAVACTEGVTAEDGKLVARGKSAHASTPDEGVNALGLLLACFAQADARVEEVYEVLFRDRAKLKEIADFTGCLTFSPNVARYEGGILYVIVDVRCPATVPYEKMCALPEKLGAPFRLLHCQRALCNDPSSFLLTALRRVYEQETGKDGTPLAIGGGTYARALENGAGFGPQFPDEPSTIHQKDEYISLENIEKLLRIYTAALRALTARDAV